MVSVKYCQVRTVNIVHQRQVFPGDNREKVNAEHAQAKAVVSTRGNLVGVLERYTVGTTKRCGMHPQSCVFSSLLR